MYISHTTINILCFIFIGMIGYLGNNCGIIKEGYKQDGTGETA